VRTQLSLEGIGALVEGVHNNPFEVLGPHVVSAGAERALAVRAYLPQSQQVWLVDDDGNTQSPMRRIHPAGIYEAVFPLYDSSAKRSYRLRMATQQGQIITMHDPYAFEPLLTDYDFYLFAEGKHLDAYRKLGGQLRQVDGVAGVNFSVWAPNAQSVSVVGDFNEWDGRRHPMRKHIPAGIWEIFIPGIAAGTKYKFRIKSCWGDVADRSDPFGFTAELPPCTASIVADLDSYAWGDEQWLSRRRTNTLLDQPISIYEVHLGSWKHDPHRLHGWMNYRDLAHQLVEYCERMGYTHIELLPISEHPFTGSWGYQTVGYYSVTSRYGSPADFMYFVDHCHRHGIGVIIDWVPAHFPRDGHGLRRFDGTALYEHEDPRQGEHPDWGTMIFNYGRNEVRNYLLSNALFWADRYHIDGLRVDAVASMLYLDYSRQEGQWIPNRYGGRENLEAIDFLREFNEQIHAAYPGILTVAEESTAWGGVSRPTTSGGLGFSMKWNMGWMNDTLRYLRNDPVHRRYHQNELTFSLIYAFSENFALPLSHDEVVHGKRSLLDQMPGDLWQRFANLRLLFSYMWTHPGKKVLFMGGDIAQWAEWSHERPLSWDLLQWETHQGIQKLVADLNQLYRTQPALYELDFNGYGFEWIDCHNSNDSVLIYLRKARNPEDCLVVCCNFTPVVRVNYLVGVPRRGFYQEVFNSDSAYYGGSNLGNYPGKHASSEGHHMRPFSIQVTMPPLGVIVLRPTG
jgi:1,4-alpha-glucan branching enzyme